MLREVFQTSGRIIVVSIVSRISDCSKKISNFCVHYSSKIGYKQKKFGTIWYHF